MAEAASPIAMAIATGKDLFALLRDVALGGLVFLLLVFPRFFNDRLMAAGFEEGSIAGLKWRGKIEESDLGLKEARTQITDLSKQLALASGKLKEAEQKLDDPKFKADVARLEADNRSVTNSAQAVAKSVSTIITSNAALVERAQAAGAGQWGVIWSGDSKLELARYEIDTVAPKLGIPKAAIYLDKNGSFRSVSVADSGDEAKAILPKAKQRRSDAYIVRMNTWCPNLVARDGYQECSR